jgi:hypothetical protein
MTQMYLFGLKRAQILPSSPFAIFAAKYSGNALRTESFHQAWKQAETLTRRLFGIILK